MNRLRRRLQPRGGAGEAQSSTAHAIVTNNAMVHVRGDYLRAELSQIEAQAKADLEC